MHSEFLMNRANKPRLIFYFRGSFELIKHSKYDVTKVSFSVVFNLLVFWIRPNNICDVW